MDESDPVDRDGVDRDGVDRDGVDRDGVDEGGVDEGGVDEGGVDEGGVDEGGGEVVLRGYRPRDLPGLHDVCLRTGAHGQDASGQTDHPMLLGEVWAAPYAVHAPELVTVLARGEEVVGYVLGVTDTRAFDAWAARTWWPSVRERYAGVDPVTDLDVQVLTGVRAGTYRSDLPADLLDRYPAHLHVDLLPAAQGAGWGRRLLERLFGQLAEAGCPGVHLGVSESNTGARAFYARLGFVELSSSPGGRTLGRSLPGS